MHGEAVEAGREQAAAYLARLETAAQTTRTGTTGEVIVWRSWGVGPPLVLLHGGSGSWRHWARNIPALAVKRRVVVPDLPGMGDSDLPPSASSRRAIAAAVLAGLTMLIAEMGTCDLAGFSFGGAVAGLATSLAPSRFRSLTLVGSGGFGAPFNDPPRQKLRGLVGLDRLAAHRANLLSLMIADPANVDDLALEIQEQNTSRSRLRGLLDRDQATLWEAFKTFPGQCNAIWGERDSFAAGHLSARMDRLRIVRPDMDLHIVPSAGHWVAFEAAGAFDAYLTSRLELLSGDPGVG